MSDGLRFAVGDRVVLVRRPDGDFEPGEAEAGARATVLSVDPGCPSGLAYELDIPFDSPVGDLFPRLSHVWARDADLAPDTAPADAACDFTPFDPGEPRGCVSPALARALDEGRGNPRPDDRGLCACGDGYCVSSDYHWHAGGVCHNRRACRPLTGRADAAAAAAEGGDRG